MREIVTLQSSSQAYSVVVVHVKSRLELITCDEIERVEKDVTTSRPWSEQFHMNIETISYYLPEGEVIAKCHT